MVSAGSHNTCVAQIDGQVKCWGLPTGPMYVGSDGPGPPPDAPQTIPLPGPASGVSVGQHAACAVMRDETVYCWGEGRWGTLGDGLRQSDSTPRQVPGLTGVREVQVQFWRVCALLRTSQVMCWGNNGYIRSIEPPPAEDGTLPDVRRFAFDAERPGGCGVTPASRLQCWGTPPPAPVMKMTDIREAAPWCVLRTRDRVTCWGHPSIGRLGGGGTASLHPPKPTKPRTAKR